MMRSKSGDRQAGATIAKSALEDETSNECGRACHRALQSRRVFALAIHLLCTQRRIAFFDHLPVMRWISHRIMEQIAAQRLDLRSFVHDDRFMDHAIAPVPEPAIE